MATRTGSIGSNGNHVYYSSPVSLGITMESGEYPNGEFKITKTANYEFEWDNVWLNSAASVTVYLCDSAGNNTYKLFDISLRARNDGWGYLSHEPNTATVSAKNLMGKALYIKMTGNTGGICSYNQSPVTIVTSYKPTVSAGSVITKAQMDSLRSFLSNTPTAVTQGAVATATVGNTYKSGLTAGTTKMTADWYNSAGT